MVGKGMVEAEVEEEIEGAEVVMIAEMEVGVMIEGEGEEEIEQDPEVEIGKEEVPVIEAWVEAGREVVTTEGEEAETDLRVEEEEEEVEVEKQAEEVAKEANPDQGHD